MAASEPSPPAPLSGFTFTRVLSDDSHSKVTCILGRKDGQDAVVLLKRRHYEPELIQAVISAKTGFEELYVNDVYHQYMCKTPQPFPDSTVDFIFPATAKHIQKYSDQARVMVRETPEVYKEKVEPFVKALPAARVEWIYNILELKAETERLLFQDPDMANGFVLLPDMKWDGINMEQLYCLALCNRRDLHSLRDLTAEHLPLLKTIRDKGCQAIQQKYGVQAANLRLFVHYHPTYYHFHVHFAHVKLQGPAVLAGKAFLLDDIIENLESVAPDYYQRRTLVYSIGVKEEHARLVLPEDVLQQHLAGES